MTALRPCPECPGHRPQVERRVSPERRAEDRERPHSVEDCRNAVREWDDAQPVHLGCGCLEGTHENTMDAMHEAHPDVLGWDYPRGPFYGVGGPYWMTFRPWSGWDTSRERGATVGLLLVMVFGLILGFAAGRVTAPSTPSPAADASPRLSLAGAPSERGTSPDSDTPRHDLGAPSPPDTATAALQGVATWYDAPSRTDAAAGPALRLWLGKGWRGTWVRVSSGGSFVSVRLTDYCACGPRHGQDTLLDLDDLAYGKLAPLSSGVVSVTVETMDDEPLPVLPQTDTIEEAIQ